MTGVAVRHAARLVTCEPQLGTGGLGVIEDGALLAEQGEIVWVGHDRDLPALSGDVREVDARGRAVLPGLIDCHTHLVFAGDRSREFAARMAGERYSSGGIAATVQATRAAPDAELEQLALGRLDRFLGFGVTTVEAKSGYGLTVEDEARLLWLAGNLAHDVDVISTFLGAHVVPDEYRGRAGEYVDIVCRDMIPAAAAGGAAFCDVWCDEGAFSVEESRRVLQAGKDRGLRPKVHADQLSHSGGAQLAAELQAVSADHLEQADEADARALARAGVVAVLLPGASLMTRGPRAPARLLLENGVRCALSTDLNPGTSYSENLPLMVALGCAELGLTVDEAVLGVTSRAAQALADDGIGRLAPGLRCDLLLLEAASEVELAYHYGSSLTHSVYKDGERVFPRGEAAALTA